MQSLTRNAIKFCLFWLLALAITPAGAFPITLGYDVGSRGNVNYDNIFSSASAYDVGSTPIKIAGDIGPLGNRPHLVGFADFLAAKAALLLQPTHWLRISQTRLNHCIWVMLWA